MTYVRPGDALAGLVKEEGINDLVVLVPINRRRLARLGPQYLSVRMLVEELKVCALPKKVPCHPLWAGRGLALYAPGGEGRCSIAVVPGEHECREVLDWRDIASVLPSPPLPAYTVDLSRIGSHLEEELRRLRVQLGVAVSVIREYLWDPHFILTSAPDWVPGWLYDVIGRSKVQVVRERPGKVLWSMRADRVYILRPDAERPLSTEEARRGDAFLVGGIVDRIPKPGLSRFLDTLVPWGEPRRIELRGSIVGVPDRINRIIEILLRTRFEGVSLERAILSSMTRRDVMARLHVELMKRKGEDPVVVYEDLRRWLPITCRDFVEALKKTGAGEVTLCED